jgi:hypothetical protein
VRREVGRGGDAAIASLGGGLASWVGVRGNAHRPLLRDLVPDAATYAAFLNDP